MDYAGGYGGDVGNKEVEMPAMMFNTGMLICQTQNQCDLFETPKNTQVMRAPNFEPNQLDAGDSLNFGGWQ